MLHTSTALRRPVTTVMSFVALVIVGLIALRLLPLEEFPDVTFPGMQVIIPYPGSTPEEGNSDHAARRGTLSSWQA